MTDERADSLGERPAVNPAPHFYAYLWIKPPGESDGEDDDGAADHLLLAAVETCQDQSVVD